MTPLPLNPPERITHRCKGILEVLIGGRRERTRSEMGEFERLRARLRVRVGLRLSAAQRGDCLSLHVAEGRGGGCRWHTSSHRRRRLDVVDMTSWWHRCCRIFGARARPRL